MTLYAKHFPKFPGPKGELDASGNYKQSSFDNQLYKRNHGHNSGACHPYIFKPNFLKNQKPTIETDESLEGLEGAKPEKKKFGRRTVDWATPTMKFNVKRRYQQFSNRGLNSYAGTGPGGGTKYHSDPLYSTTILPPFSNVNNTSFVTATRFVRTATNKRKCQILKVVWTPDGKRLITGSSTGEFTLWNGTTFNFETIMQAHESMIRAMCWSRGSQWLVSGDQNGYIKYWQQNMNNVHMFLAHPNVSIRGITFCPDDTMFATCADDHTIQIWDFLRTRRNTDRPEEISQLRGHGSEVKVVQWHPTKCLIASGSKDLQSPVKLWDPKNNKAVATLHCHKGTVMDLKWNNNGKWFATASRDHTVKVFDVRNLSEELQTFRGHKTEAASLAWHPQHECSLSSGGGDGSIYFWGVGENVELAHIDKAHFNQDSRNTSIIWSMEWHPLGHLLCSGSNDNTARFWTRNRPGDDIDDTGCNRDVSDHNEYHDENTSYGPFKHNTGYVPGGGQPGNLPTEQVRRTVADRIYSFLMKDDIIPGLETPEQREAEFLREQQIGQKISTISEVQSPAKNIKTGYTRPDGYNAAIHDPNYTPNYHAAAGGSMGPPQNGFAGRKRPLPDESW